LEKVVAMRVLGMSTILLMLGVTTLISQNVGQSDTKMKSQSAMLRGRVERVEVGTADSPSKYATTPVAITLELSITNTGTDPLIFLQRDPECHQAVIGRNADELDVRNRQYLAYSGRSSSEVTSAKWASLRRSLDKPSPPSALTRTLKPGETLRFDGWIRIDLANDPKMYASLGNRSESLSRLQELSPVLLQVRCEAWPHYLEGADTQRQNLVFGRELQLRWKAAGLLWLDEIYSEPITLDLKPVMKPDN
jgi:hypothetical protein